MFIFIVRDENEDELFENSSLNDLSKIVSLRIIQPTICIFNMVNNYGKVRLEYEMSPKVILSFKFLFAGKQDLSLIHI